VGAGLYIASPHQQIHGGNYNIPKPVYIKMEMELIHEGDFPTNSI